MSKIVIIPSAKLAPIELQSEFGSISSAMIPLDSRPALHYIAEYYVAQKYKIYIAVDEKSEDIFSYCSEHKELDITVIDVGKTSSLGQTILNTLKSFATMPDELVINFADTSIDSDIIGGNSIFYSLTNSFISS